MQISELEAMVPWRGYYETRFQLRDYMLTHCCQALYENAKKLESIASPASLANFQKEIRGNLIHALNLLGMKRLSKPKCVIVNSSIQNDILMENLYFHSWPKMRVTANLYRPEKAGERMPAVLLLSGHALDGKAFASYQNVCQSLAAQGMVVLAIDPPGQGERSNFYITKAASYGVSRTIWDHDQCGVLSLLCGVNLSAFFLRDAQCALDYLISRRDVDASRIGVTGSSGGATQSLLLAALDERVKAVALSSFITDRKAILDSGSVQDAEQIWEGMDSLGLGHAELLMLLAPRPTLLLAAEYDFFPIEGTYRTLETARKAWKISGKSTNIKLISAKARHGYSDEMCKHACEFFRKIFSLRKKLLHKYWKPVALPLEKLQVTKSGQLTGDFPDEQTIPMIIRKEVLDKKKQSLPRTCKWLKARMKQLDGDAALHPKWYRTAIYQGRQVDAVCWWMIRGLMAHGKLFRPISNLHEILPVTIAVWDGGSSVLSNHMDWILRETAKKRVVFVVDLPGNGALGCHAIGESAPGELYGTERRIADQLSAVGKNLSILRAHAIQSAIRLLSETTDINKNDVCIHAVGSFSLYAKIAWLSGTRQQKLDIHSPSTLLVDMLNSDYFNAERARSFIIPGMFMHGSAGHFS